MDLKFISLDLTRTNATFLIFGDFQDFGYSHRMPFLIFLLLADKAQWNISTQVIAKNKAQSKQIHEKKILADSKLANLILVSKLLS